jgi:hypothetical protein
MQARAGAQPAGTRASHTLFVSPTVRMSESQIVARRSLVLSAYCRSRRFYPRFVDSAQAKFVGRGFARSRSMPVLDPNLITPGQHERRVSHEPQRLRLVVVTGAFSVALGLGAFGESNCIGFLIDETSWPTVLRQHEVSPHRQSMRRLRAWRPLRYRATLQWSSRRSI